LLGCYTSCQQLRVKPISSSEQTNAVIDPHPYNCKNRNPRRTEHPNRRRFENLVVVRDLPSRGDHVRGIDFHSRSSFAISESPREHRQRQQKYQSVDAECRTRNLEPNYGSRLPEELPQISANY